MKVPMSGTWYLKGGTMTNTKLVIFDLDGTLTDTIEGLATAMNKVLEKRGFPQHSNAAVMTFVGNGLRNLAKRALPESERTDDMIDACHREMLVAYETYYDRGLVLYPGMDEVLDDLTKRGIKLAINTNKAQKMATVIANGLLGKWNFIEVIGDCEEFPKKPDPTAALHLAKVAGVKINECVYIGDSEVDIKTARNAEMKAITVSWGFRDQKDLMLHNPEILISDAKEILLHI